MKNIFSLRQRVKFENFSAPVPVIQAYHSREALTYKEVATFCDIAALGTNKNLLFSVLLT